MRKIANGFIGIGILFIGVFAFADLIGLGKGGQLGAAQLGGIEIGIAFLLTGIGFSRVDWGGNWDFTGRLRAAGTRLLDSSPTVWAVSAFLTCYVALFIFPMFFSKSTIHYFDRYIPDAWVTRIGYDTEQTVSHIETWLTEGTSPYADGIVPYSPLTLAVFAPFVALEGRTIVGARCEVGSFVRLRDVRVGDGATVSGPFALEGGEIAPGARVGPPT